MDIRYFTKAEVCGKPVKDAKCFQVFLHSKVQNICFFASCVWVVYSWFLERKEYGKKMTFPKVWETVKGEFITCREVLYWRPELGNEQGGNELGDVDRREENQLFLSLRPIYICHTSDSNVSQELLSIKGSSLNNAVLFFSCSSQLSEII